MLSPESFIQNLLEMRSHYQTRVNQCDRLVTHAQEQLLHINALLVDEALDNQQFVENLLQMRLLPALREAQSHYQTLVDEQRRSSASALEQLVHINALLAEQLVAQHENEQAISMQANTYREDLALAEAAEEKRLSLAVEQLELSSALGRQVESVEPPDAQKSTSEPKQTSSTSIFIENQLEQVKQNQPQSSLADELPTQKVENSQAHRGNKSQLNKSPLLLQYQHLTRSEAVEKLLQDNIGTILHTDYIVRSLYGNLEKEAFKVEKQRLYETLGKGVAKGLWDKVPDQPGCYTVELKLVEREVKLDRKPASSGQAIASKSNGTLKLLPAYKHLNYTQAVGTVLRENQGQEMDSEKVARTLYGDLEAKDLTEAKHKIGKILWTGARQKRWQSVVGKLGVYTMASDSIKQG